MSFPALSMSGMPGVLVGFVDHLQARRGESLGQLLGDDIASCHGLGIAGAGPVGQSGENRSPRSGVGRCPSEREACPAAAGCHSLRVVDAKRSADQVIDEIDLGTGQISDEVWSISTVAPYRRIVTSSAA
jgi:hypothetical protein